MALIIAGIIRGIQSTLPLGGEAFILLKQHPDVFAQAYQDKIFLQTYGNLLGRPRLFSRQTPIHYQPETNFGPKRKVSASGGGQIEFKTGSSPSDKSQVPNENEREPKEEYIFVKIIDENERLKLSSEDERLKDNVANNLSKTESNQSVINASLGKSPQVEFLEEDEIMKGNEVIVNEEQVRDGGNGELEITRRDERENVPEREEKEREEQLGSIKSATSDDKVIEESKQHQERQDIEDDGNSYAPFEVVVQLRQRKTVQPLVLIERTESGKDKYRSRGYKQTNYRKIERLEETQYFEEEWDKERKVELKENGKVVRDEEDKIKYDIAKHYAKHPGAGHPEIAAKAKVPKVRPDYWDTYKYHAPQLSKDFKINDNFRQWVLQIGK